MGYDFSGWATRHDRLCSDGRVIKQNAFIEDDGKKVPLVWNHQHDTPDNVLGHAVLENREDGVYMYGTFNDGANGEIARKLVKHGDISGLSIYANKLKQKGRDVVHGVIREVSLVYASANPDAYIENVLVHGEVLDDEAVIYSGENIESLEHSEGDGHMGNNKTGEDSETTEKTIQDVLDTMSDEQLKAVEVIVSKIMMETDDEDDEDNGGVKTKNQNGGTEMKHNVFEGKDKKGNTLTHADGADIIKLAKNNAVGTLKNAIAQYEAEHDVVVSHGAFGGFSDVERLFPDYSEVRPGVPEVVTYDQGWVDAVIKNVHKSPISRIRTTSTDIRKIDDLRAKGHTKSAEKKDNGNLSLARRTTDPQTVYVKDKLHRDDVVDITDFNYVDYMYGINNIALRQELATAMLIGDGRDESSDDKIKEDHIRPVWLDDDLYTIHRDLNIEKFKNELQGTDTAASFGNNFIVAEAMVETVLKAKESYKGSGNPDMFISTYMLNVMLLARDKNGRRIYSTVAEIASALNVNNIYTVEQFVDKIRKTKDGLKKKLVALIINVADYTLGATKGGEITHFTDFDIDFNAYKSLLETRASGANTRIYSAIAIEEPVV